MYDVALYEGPDNLPEVIAENKSWAVANHIAAHENLRIEKEGRAAEVYVELVVAPTPGLPGCSTSFAEWIT